MREIEVKYRVDDLEALLAALKSRDIEVSDPLHQDDQAYAPLSWQFGDSKLGVSFLRLRTADGRHYFTLKQPAQNDQAWLEYETEVTDREAMHHAALHMGYRPTVRIIKTRRTASEAARCASTNSKESATSSKPSAWPRTTLTHRQSKSSSPHSSNPSVP